MSIPRIYIDDDLAEGAALPLVDEPFRHAIQVLRLREGEAVNLFNGRGGEYSARIESIGRRDALLRLDRFDAVDRESPLWVTLLQGVSKGERMDYSVQKAVELGVAAIVPVLTERCNVKLDAERWEKKLAHWRGVAIAACEQSGRTRLPKLQAPLALDSALALARDHALCLTLDPLAERGLYGPAPQGPVALLVGPEGGLSTAEVLESTSQGFIPVRLGPRVLRTETAGPALLAALQARWGDLA